MCFKKLTHIVTDAGKSETYRVQIHRLSVGRIPSCLREVSLLFYSGLQRIRSGPPTSWKAIFSAQSPRMKMLISFKNILTETSRISFQHISGHYGPARLIYKIKHHDTTLYQQTVPFQLLSFQILRPMQAPLYNRTSYILNKLTETNGLTGGNQLKYLIVISEPRLLYIINIHRDILSIYSVLVPCIIPRIASPLPEGTISIFSFRIWEIRLSKMKQPEQEELVVYVFCLKICVLSTRYGIHCLKMQSPKI